MANTARLAHLVRLADIAKPARLAEIGKVV